MKHLKLKTYLKFIENSLDSNLFRNSFVEVDGQSKDILENGNLSCAFYVCCVLKVFDLISHVHATVDGTINDLVESNWYEIEIPREGAILVWEKSEINNDHRHIGFYLGDNTAISNSTSEGRIVRHSWNYEGDRKIEKIFWNKELNKK